MMDSGFVLHNKNAVTSLKHNGEDFIVLITNEGLQIDIQVKGTG